MTSTGPRGTPAFDALLETAATWVVAGTLLWGAALLLAALVERGSRGRLSALHWAGCPRRARPLLLALAGLAVLLPGAAHAAATAEVPRPGGGTLPVPSRPTDDGTAPAPPHPAVGPAARPADRPAGSATDGPEAGPVTVTGTELDAVVTVRPGDSLWALSRVRLGPRATEPEVAALVERLHRRNLGVVGPDPDLLRPGQRLRFPTIPTPPPPTEAP